MDICTDLITNSYFDKSALTIGSFDGMHCGHMEIINTLIKISNNKKMPSVVVTFDPNPKQIIKAENSSQYFSLMSINMFPFTPVLT